MLKKIIAAAFACCVITLGFSLSAQAEVKEEGFYINATHVNVRLQPSLEGEIIDQVNPGCQIFPTSVNGINSNWTENIYNGQVCYIYSKYISYIIPEQEQEIEYVDEELPNIKSLGVHKVTTYCSCEQCCGKGGGIVTASGTTPTVGRTIGCNWLPFGTRVLIEGHEYIVEDRGSSKFKGFDIYWGNDHNAALNSGFGRKIEIFIVEG